jgi:hypothetical protein
MDRIIQQTRPALEDAHGRVTPNEPIIEPGGELPPEIERSDNGA